MPTLQAPHGQNVVLNDIDWRTYSRLLRVFADRRGVRLTYDRGKLEIMSPLPAHETAAYLLGRFVDTLTEECGLPVKAGRSTTFRRRRKRRGLEADNSYWIINEALVRGKQTIDLRVDPPPDLALEIDVTRSSLNRMKIYAALRVPEVWRLDESGFACQLLQDDGTYAPSDRSKCFPWLNPADLLPFVRMRESEEDNEIIRRLRQWIRQQKKS